MLTEKLKQLRQDRKLNQEECARALGVSKTTYIGYEKGKQSPQLSTLQKAAEFYGVTLFELLGSDIPVIDNQLMAKFKAIQELEEEEKRSLMVVMEGLLLRHQSKQIAKQFK